MPRTRRAFTLVEMIVVLAIVATISAILFPVLTSAKGAAHRANCMSNLRQITQGTFLYAADYEERLMPVNHRPGEGANSRNDRTWVQTLLPYVRSFSLFKCPSDFSRAPLSEATFDQDLVPGDTDSQYYTASLHSNYGYNYQNLSPVVQEADGWVARPREMSDVASASGTFLFIDSAWSHVDKRPAGGGNWLVVPPCRYYRSSVDSFTNSRNAVVYTPILGWKLTDGGNGSLYGNAWPWHEGRMNVAHLDGSVASLVPRQLGAGCDVREAWSGSIGDAISYQWDIR